MFAKNEKFVFFAKLSPNLSDHYSISYTHIFAQNIVFMIIIFKIRAVQERYFRFFLVKIVLKYQNKCSLTFL